jgi:hypothetical protein
LRQAAVDVTVGRPREPDRRAVVGVRDELFAAYERRAGRRLDPISLDLACIGFLVDGVTPCARARSVSACQAAGGRVRDCPLTYFRDGTDRR